ncbi:sugar-binding transcriptional regulator [Roseibium sp.]|uniref:sugar-binding transcriptional regulator n=1 Tax=Roseibium sp. TaxID=1936156 RepID=UPI003D0F1F27
MGADQVTTSRLTGAATDALASGRGSRQEALIVEAAWCYYHEGMNQNEIADRMGLSRATIVNYLSEARRRDYVRVSLNSDVFRNHDLAQKLVEKFNLRDALVVPPDPIDPTRTFDRVAKAAADWLPDLLVPGDRLGVSWGETIYAVAENAPLTKMQNLTVVQLVGSRPAAAGFAAEACSSMISQRFSCDCVNLHVPLIVSSEALAETLRAEPIISEELDAVATCNKTIFAIGTCLPDSHIVRSGLLTPEELETYAARGATGVMCGRLIDEHGNPVRSHVENRMLGVELEQMRNKEMAMLVSSGNARIKPILAAIRGGYATHLVTCTETAAGILDGADN